MTQIETGAPLRLAVIIGSTREGRVGAGVAGWFTAHARRRAGIEQTVVDLADFRFPVNYPEQATPPMTAFAAEIDRADAFVIVTPEYNRSFPASLKQAIDYAYDEWQAKPVGFVSYGCRSGGFYAVEQLRTVFTELHTVTMRNGVSFNLLDGSVDDQGRPLDGDDARHAATTMLDQLIWWGLALRDARTTRPYVA